MKNDEILEMLESIENDLDDANNSLPDYPGTSDSRSYIDGARCSLYYLKDEIEKSIIDEPDVPLDEVMNTSPSLAKGL